MVKKKKGKSRKGQKNPWLDHLKSYRAKHPEKSFGECMSAAKMSYKKIA